MIIGFGRGCEINPSLYLPHIWSEILRYLKKALLDHPDKHLSQFDRLQNRFG
jgi:hypothetical protein